MVAKVRSRAADALPRGIAVVTVGAIAAGAIAAVIATVLAEAVGLADALDAEALFAVEAVVAGAA